MYENKEVLTYNYEGGSVKIETEEYCSHIDTMLNNLVRPMLRAAGFAESTINETIGEYR